MTEEEWAASDDPWAMLDWLGSGRLAQAEGVGSCEAPFECRTPRKLRLFACACVRVAWAGLMDRRSRKAVLVAERNADGEVTDARLAAANRDARRAWNDRPVTSVAVWEAWHVADPSAMSAVRFVLGEPSALPRTRPQEAALLREVFGNPHDAPSCPVCHGTRRVRVPRGEPSQGTDELPCLDCPGRLARLTPDALAMARAAYEERLPDATLDPVRLAILVDALEEAGYGPVLCLAGCRKVGDAYKVYTGGTPYDSGWERCLTCGGDGRVPHPLVAHLRAPGPHVRGCWALDVVLGKE